MEKLELSKKELDSIYRIIETTKRSGVLKKGTNEVTKSAERGDAKFVIIAEDVSPKEIIMHLPMICDEKNIPYVWVPKKSELGASAGLTAQCSSVAIVKEGDSKKLLLNVISDLKKKSKPSEKPKEEKKEESSEKKVEETKKEDKPKESKKEEKSEETPKKKETKEQKKKDSKEIKKDSESKKK